MPYLSISVWKSLFHGADKHFNKIFLNEMLLYLVIK